MVRLVIAVSVIGALLVATAVVGMIKIKQMDKNLTTLAECLLTYMTNPNSVDIIEDIPVSRTANFTFPNSEGF
jgi:hypothetical protein